MSYKYSKVRTIESFKDGTIYQINKFVTSDDTDNIPHAGVLASWAPTTSYVISVESSPDSQNNNYKITAKDVSKVMEEGDLKGRFFHKTFFYENSSLSSNIPRIGDTASWARLTAYVINYKIMPCGSNWLIDITAAEEGSAIQGG